MIPIFYMFSDESATLIEPLRTDIASLCDNFNVGHGLLCEPVERAFEELAAYTAPTM